jgi:hypothetical protein
MSRRKSRSAPSNPENLFADDAPVTNRQQKEATVSRQVEKPIRSRGAGAGASSQRQSRYQDADQADEEDQGYYQPTRAIAAGTGVAAAQAARRGSQTQQRSTPPTPAPAPAPASFRTRNASSSSTSLTQDFDDNDNDNYDHDFPPHRHPIQSSSSTLPQKFTQYSEPTDDDEIPASSDIVLYQCEHCSRKFNPIAFNKHQKICEKVFSGPKKIFNMAAKRLEGTGAEKILKKKNQEEKKNIGSRGTTSRNHPNPEEIAIKTKKDDWKKKSEQFRQAMQASREVSQALKEGR